MTDSASNLLIAGDNAIPGVAIEQTAPAFGNAAGSVLPDEAPIFSSSTFPMAGLRSNERFKPEDEVSAPRLIVPSYALTDAEEGDGTVHPNLDSSRGACLFIKKPKHFKLRDQEREGRRIVRHSSLIQSNESKCLFRVTIASKESLNFVLPMQCFIVRPCVNH
jgi:hypothetical protein